MVVSGLLLEKGVGNGRIGGPKGTGGGSFKRVRSKINRGNHLSKNGQKDKAKQKGENNKTAFKEACPGVQATRSGTWETSWEDCEAHKNSRSVVY